MNFQRVYRVEGYLVYLTRAKLQVAGSKPLSLIQRWFEADGLEASHASGDIQAPSENCRSALKGLGTLLLAFLEI